MAGTNNDFYVFDVDELAWADISAAVFGVPPSPRAYHAIASAGGKLYVHGGWSESLGSCICGEGVIFKIGFRPVSMDMHHTGARTVVRQATWTVCTNSIPGT